MTIIVVLEGIEPDDIGLLEYVVNEHFPTAKSRFYFEALHADDPPDTEYENEVSERLDPQVMEIRDALLPLVESRSEVRECFWGMLRGSNSRDLTNFRVDGGRLLKLAGIRASNALRPILRTGRRSRIKDGPLYDLVRKEIHYYPDGTYLCLQYHPTELGIEVLAALKDELDRRGIQIPEVPHDG